MSVKQSTYNSHPVLELISERGFQIHLRFGVSKARLILDNLEAVQKFVQENGP